MKLAIVYDPTSSKLHKNAYSYTYRYMFDEVVRRFDHVNRITWNQPADRIEADVILFYDVNSCHHIKLKGIEKHPALKIEYMSDPHQKAVHGIYGDTGLEVLKLNAEQRIQRALNRGVSYIISPVKQKFFEFYGNILGEEQTEKMLWHFPQVPGFKACHTPLLERRHISVLGNGCTWDGGISAYEFRKWAYTQPCVFYVKHCIQKPSIPHGFQYVNLLKQFSAGLALSELYPVNKYYEMPLAGMLTFAQYHKDYEELGFKDWKHCIYVNQVNFNEIVPQFLEDMKTGQAIKYQEIADNGRDLMENNYTARHFADWLYKKCYEIVGGGI